MPGPLYLTVASGATVSSAFYLDRLDRCYAIEVPSYGTASNVQLAFTQNSGTAPFGVKQRDNGDGLPYTVFSGAGGSAWCVMLMPPTPWGRIVLGASQSVVVTFTILPR